MKPIKIEIWKRFDLYYHAKLPAFRLWKRGLGWVALVACVVWLGAAEWDTDRTPYASGPMSRGHEFLARNCRACHTDPMQGFMQTFVKDKSMNAACLDCHQNSIGHDTLTMSAWHQWPGPGPSRASEAELACSFCHTEHSGPIRLTEMDDSKCVRCHANLEECKPDSVFASEISSFATNHPEFQIRIPSQDAAPAGDGRPTDPGRLKFPHDRHLRDNLPVQYVSKLDSPGAEPAPDADRPRVNLRCYDCHRHGLSTQEWKYSRAELHDRPGLAATHSEPSLQAAYMEPIRYSLHCAKCHPLGSDSRFSGQDAQVPHLTPPEIRTFLWGEFGRFIKANPIVLERGSEDVWRQPTFIKSDEPKELTPAQHEQLLVRVEEEVKKYETRIYRDRGICHDCHEVVEPPAGSGELISIVPPNIPERWYGSASFSHERHRVLDCLECHAEAPAKSESGGKPMLPVLKVCRACHGPLGGTPSGPAAGVSDRCVLCHTFHRPVGVGLPRVGKSLSELKANRGD